jgi:hypothetical protein
MHVVHMDTYKLNVCVCKSKMKNEKEIMIYIKNFHEKDVKNKNIRNKRTQLYIKHRYKNIRIAQKASSNSFRKLDQIFSRI